MAVKFPLKMADSAMVRTLEELREHFDLTAILAYYDNGRLATWLKNGCYDEEAEKIAALSAASDKFVGELCDILGVDYHQSSVDQIDLGGIKKMNERLVRLKQFTVDDTILAAVDSVAFTQKELDELLNQGDAEEIYLCGKRFAIPDIEDIVYIGVNNPTIRFKKNYIAAGIDIQNVEFDEESIGDCEHTDNPVLYMKLLRIAAETGSAKAQRELGDCYFDGQLVEKDLAEAQKWYEKAADRGSSIAQERLQACLLESMQQTANSFSNLGQMFESMADELDAQEDLLLSILGGGEDCEDDENSDKEDGVSLSLLSDGEVPCISLADLEDDD